ncbi:hypothetical protein SKAU_G00132750 [Synaphobranchus kaupii]|uniref:Anion exchange protein n=1 Tax=Synaphobranchus kaupii TaxID=118154 RepID=A0A9Q1J2I0_SYNKA|nr:hypothetical protein SKAU_G00132750 [Synaphobranchus kaupii]
MLRPILLKHRENIEYRQSRYESAGEQWEQERPGYEMETDNQLGGAGDEREQGGVEWQKRPQCSWVPTTIHRIALNLCRCFTSGEPFPELYLDEIAVFTEMHCVDHRYAVENGSPNLLLDSDMSYEEGDSSFSPFTLGSPGNDLELLQKEQSDPYFQRITIYPDLEGEYGFVILTCIYSKQHYKDDKNSRYNCTARPLGEAALNVNTNANSRPDYQAYVELNELMKDQNQQGYWQETGRWVGYEENYDPEAGSWGPSHISYLTFKSLIQLRKTMSTGVVMLDREERTLNSIAEKVADELVNKKEIRPSDREGLLRSLLQSRSQLDPKETQALSSGLEMKTFSVAERRDASDIVEASMVLVGALDFLQKPTVAFVRLKEAVVLDSALEAPVPVRFVFVLVGPSQSGMDYHETGRAMAALMADKVFNLAAFQARGERELTAAVADFMDCSIVIPPTEIQNESMLKSIIGFQKKLLQDRLRPADPLLSLDTKPRTISKVDGPPPEDPLARTGRPFGGMIRDMKRYRHYISDITDAMNTQVLAAVIFIYFAALSPAITFGGLLADKTENMMGVSELLISTAIQGIIFCFIAAQPVLVIGFSGPLLVFEEAFFAFCKSQGIEYIVGRVWVGIWLVVIVVVIVAVEGSFLVRYISRFTQEIFSILISLIFIYETFAKLIKIFKSHPLTLNYDHLNTTAEDPFHTVFEHQHNHDNATGNVTTPGGPSTQGLP